MSLAKTLKLSLRRHFRVHEITLISINKHQTGGADGWETLRGISYDGNFATFTISGTDVVFGDHNATYDVFLWQAGALPRLSIVLSGSKVQLSWPSDSPPAVLETRTPEANWEAVAGPVQQVEDRYRYETSVDGPPRFFQLRLL